MLLVSLSRSERVPPLIFRLTTGGRRLRSAALLSALARGSATKVNSSGRKRSTRCPQLRLAEDGEHPRTARKSRHLAHPGQRQRPIGRWCEGPVPRPAPHPKPSILGPAARWRAIVPAPGTWTPESAAGASHWYPFRHRLRNRSISLTPITNPLLSPGHANPGPPLHLPHASAYFTLALV